MVKEQKPHKKPQRSCVVCRATTEKQTLLRFVRTSEGQVCFDATGRQPGRGAYLCFEQQCFEKAKARHLLDRALKTKLSDGDYERLAKELSVQGREVNKV